MDRNMIPNPSFKMPEKSDPQTSPRNGFILVYETEVVTSIKSLNQTQMLKVSTIIFQTFKEKNIEPEIIENLFIILYSSLSKLRQIGATTGIKFNDGNLPFIYENLDCIDIKKGLDFYLSADKDTNTSVCLTCLIQYVYKVELKLRRFFNTNQKTGEKKLSSKQDYNTNRIPEYRHQTKQ